MIEQVKHIKDKVFKLLTEKPHLRDSDQKLIANIWNCELKAKGISTKSLTAYDFLEAFANDQHTSPESIMRVRRKIQEQNPELRGTAYENRKKESVKFKNEIHSV